MLCGWVISQEQRDKILKVLLRSSSGRIICAITNKGVRCLPTCKTESLVFCLLNPYGWTTKAPTLAANGTTWQTNLQQQALLPIDYEPQDTGGIWTGIIDQFVQSFRTTLLTFWQIFSLLRFTYHSLLTVLHRPSRDRLVFASGQVRNQAFHTFGRYPLLIKLSIPQQEQSLPPKTRDCCRNFPLFDRFSFSSSANDCSKPPAPHQPADLKSGAGRPLNTFHVKMIFDGYFRLLRFSLPKHR